VRRLEKWQWNPIIKAIEEVGLDPRDFDLDDDGDTAIIRPRRSEGFFAIGKDGSRRYDVSKAVGEQSPTGYPVHIWPTVEERFALWLDEVKRDQETPDLFAELRCEREMLAAATAEDVENTPFSADEQREIAGQLRAIKEYVKKTYELSEHQMQALEAGLDDIGEKVGRLGRREWITYAAGTLAILQATVLAPETTRHIFMMLLQSLAQLKGYTLPELPGGAG
jgi:hypothetical protein